MLHLLASLHVYAVGHCKLVEKELELVLHLFTALCRGPFSKNPCVEIVIRAQVVFYLWKNCY